MTEGTRSYLFGCHHFLIHPLVVIIAWKKLYKYYPKPWEIGCIFLHDIGHIGKNYLTYYSEKKKHWELGARIARRLFGVEGGLLVASHSAAAGIGRGRMYWPDKYSWLIAPRWWLILNDKVEGFDKTRTLDEFLETAKTNWENGCPHGTHQIYLDFKGEE
jgi:hypothetical protein